MSNLLAEKLRKARRSVVEADGVKFTISRPTDADAATLGGSDLIDIVKRFTVDWEVTELWLGIPGGTDVKVPFDAELFGEWVADNPSVWGPLAEAIVGSYRIHTEKRDKAEKN